MTAWDDEEARRLLSQLDEGEGLDDQPRLAYAFRPGGDFILDTSPDPEAIWGRGEDVLLADGEALIIAGRSGLGKTTLAQQLGLGRAGLDEYATLLGYPIVPGRGRVLYLAMDRPRQAARSFRRMVGEAWRDQLNDKIRVWPGPPPQDLAQFPSLLAQLCDQAGADTVIVDSLKDAAIGLNADEIGAGWNRARQQAIAAGVQVVELHHNRKEQAGNRGGAPNLDDVYGSVWISGGAGSVILLTGSPGDPIVGLHHIKQPNVEVGPLRVIHEHSTGRSHVWHGADVVELAKQVGGITAADAARALFDTEKPTANEREKARRKLENAQRVGLLVVLEHGSPAANTATVWGPK